MVFAVLNHSKWQLETSPKCIAFQVSKRPSPPTDVGSRLAIRPTFPRLGSQALRRPKTPLI